VAAAAALASGCGTAVTGAGGTAVASPGTSPSVPVFANTMNPGGTVPWVSTSEVIAAHGAVRFALNRALTGRKPRAGIVGPGDHHEGPERGGTDGRRDHSS
jgi:hypothetical protein